jgi:hypothetical protein
MRQFTRPIRHALNNAQRRFIRSRSGSVLILVVALLVLMALIGTAFMTMAQFDRVASTQHTFNTEVDMLLDGVINQVKGVVGGDLFVNNQYRPATVANGAIVAQYNSGTIPSYNYYNGLGYGLENPLVVSGKMNGGNWWLANRIPALNTSDATPPNTLNNYPMWPFITGPINGSGQYDSPLWEAGAGPLPVNYTNRARLAPTATDIQLDGQFWPAFFNVPGYTKAILAADADGDGIADSGLVKLLTLDGVTYYAAVRIVDNSAGVDASIAQTPNPFSTYVPNQQMPGDLSPVNIDLEGMLVNSGSTYSSWSAPLDMYGPSATPASLSGPGLLPNFRFNKKNATTAQTLSPQPIADNNTPTPTVRSDFRYLPYAMTYPGANPISTSYVFDQQWLQLGRRLRHPGYAVRPASPTDTTALYQALPISETMTMARDFILRDPRISTASSSASVLEMRMPNSTFQSPYGMTYPTTPYQPIDAGNWFLQNFYYWSDFDGTRTSPPALTPTMPIRALLTSENPVSNFAPNKFNLNPTSTPFQFGDVVTSGGYKYVCICPGTTGPQALDQYWSDSNWAWEPWTNSPTKTSVNTATFQQLYAAYWAVMADQYTAPVGATPAQWAPAFPNTSGGEARMFRNPARSWYSAGGGVVTPSPLTPTQTMYLRSAIAAINTMQLRGGNQADYTTYGTQDVLSRTINIPDATGSPHYQANVYGVEKQPYLTHIYARNDPQQPTNDFMAVEFYNPFNTAITISGWKLGLVDRTNKGNLTVTTLDGTPTGKTLKLEVTSPSALTTIGAKSWVVLVSSLSPPSTVKLPATTANWYECTDLSKAFGKELVLMRPRLAKGTPISAGLANNKFQEGTSFNSATGEGGLYDWIPIDSYDFTNIKPTSLTTTPQEWQYLRPTDPASNKDWHFVYPGPWQVTAAATGTGTANPNPTWSATVVTAAPPPLTDLGPMGFGQVHGTPLTGGGVIYQDVALQVNNQDFGGPNKPSTTGANNSVPLGAFPRNGDILQTTFIGAYKLYDVSAGAPRLVELNTISDDSAMATAQDLTGKYQPIANAAVTAENIGRFCPIDGDDATTAGVAGVNDYLAASTNWRYHWASRIFDFLTVQAPQDDYLPNVDPWSADPNYFPNFRYRPADTYTQPVPVANVTTSANAGFANRFPTPVLPLTATSEDTAPVDGLVNVNTAPWRVLAAVPWVPATTANYRATNALIGIQLAFARDINGGTGVPHGPFKNLFDLGETMVGAKKLRDVLQTSNSSSFTLAQGNLTSTTVANDVKGDFLATFNTITRISNLVTTRSDSYTAYILVQGWRNAETAAPHLVVQRRAAIILDRSVVTPTNKLPNTTNVPQ